MVERIKDWLYGIKADKLLHFICGLIVAQVFFALLNIGCVKRVSLLVSLLLSTIVAGAKELIDIRCGVPSWKDFAASMIGIVVGLLIMLCV